MIFVVLVAELLSRRPRYARLRTYIPLLWGLTAASAIGTVVLGLMHYSEGGFDGGMAVRHRNYGIAFALCVTLAALASVVWRDLYDRAIRIPACLLALILITMTGHYGGNLTHGSTYLVELAPQPIRTLAGLAPERPAVTSLQAADVYLDVIGPMLANRCVTCHNKDKRSGGLDLTSHANLMRGGEKGTVVVPGKSGESDLQRRVSLPSDAEDFMPKGKTPLRPEQIAILQWWIDAGAPAGGALGGMKLAGLAPALSTQLGLTRKPAATGPAAKADPAIVARLYEAGFVVRQMSLEDPLLDVAVYSPGHDVTDKELDTLATAADRIVRLDLRLAGIDDADLKRLDLRKFSKLQVLLLSNDRVSDSSLGVLADLPQLRQLNLYGNAGITDAGVASLSNLKQLESLYLWRTGVSAQSVAKLSAILPKVKIDAGESQPSRPAQRPMKEAAHVRGS